MKYTDEQEQKINDEVIRVLQIKAPDLKTLEDQTPLDGLDSLGVVDLITSAEEIFDVTLSYELVRAMKTVGEFGSAIERELDKKCPK